MATFTLNLRIDKTIMKQHPADNLNIAKKVNGVFTTTFTGASVKPVGNQKQLLELNKFQWTEQYGVLLSMTYKGGMQISAATDSQKLQFGEKTTFDDEDKVLSDPATATATEFEDGATPTDSFVVGNVPDYLHASVACKESPGSNKWLVLYVDQVQHSGPMNKTLTPINTYSLFWDSKVITDSIIDYTKTVKPFEFDFPAGKTEHTLRWGYAKPNAPSGVTEQPKWYPWT